MPSPGAKKGTAIMGLASEAKAAGSAVKSHWLIFVLGGLGLVGFAIWYDHKHNGALTKKLAAIPFVGKAFA